MLDRCQNVALQALACSLLFVAAANAEPREFTLDTQASHVLIHVEKGGLFGFMGHDHEVEAPLASGVVVVDSEDVTASSVELEFEMAALKVVDPESPNDIDEVQAKMQSDDVLGIAQFPGVSFHSTSVEGSEKAGVWELKIRGVLDLHGMQKEVEVPLTVSLEADSLTAAGILRIKQKDFGITPVSIAGVVKVKNDLDVEFSFEGAASGEASPEGDASEETEDTAADSL